MVRKFIAPAVAAAAALYAAPSQAADLVSDCSVLGLDDIVPNAIACVGYYDKNVLKTSAGGLASDDELAALLLLDLAGPLTVKEKIENSGNFATVLSGLTWIGVHYGNGQGPVSNSGGVTAFYKFDAGASLDSFGFTNGSVSGVALYQTSTVVPEPSTWALLIGGLGLTGAVLRRRKVQVQFS